MSLFTVFRAPAVVGAALTALVMFAGPSDARAASRLDGASAAAPLADVVPVEMQRRRGGFTGARPGVGPRAGYRGGRGSGNVGAAVGIGAAALLLGAAAAAASQPRECWVERRWVDTPYGPEPRRVRICR